MSKYDEDLKKACEILNNTELDELVQIAVEAMDDAVTDIGMEASQEWHAKITLESALIHIAEKVAKRPSLTIPKSIADEIDCVVNPIGQIVLKSGILSDFTVEAISWIYKNNENGYIAIAYANPLTRDLVRVVEG